LTVVTCGADYPIQRVTPWLCAAGRDSAVVSSMAFNRIGCNDGERALLQGSLWLDSDNREIWYAHRSSVAYV
jgi:hypothetical protein